MSPRLKHLAVALSLLTFTVAAAAVQAVPNNSVPPGQPFQALQSQIDQNSAAIAALLGFKRLLWTAPTVEGSPKVMNLDTCLA